MVKSKWINNDDAKELINRISKQKLKNGQKYHIKHSHKDYKSAFELGNMDLYKILLKNLIRFNSEIPDAYKTDIVTKAIFESADNNKLQLSYLAEVIKTLEQEYLKKSNKTFILVTRVTIIGIKNKITIRTKDSIITISKYFPKIYKSTYDFEQASNIHPNLNQKMYSWVTVEIMARCVHSAADKALGELNYWLGLMNVFYSYGVERQSFEKASPINKIRKYPYHSLHLPTGERATKQYWYEPNYSNRGGTLKVDDKFIKAKKFYNKLSSRILSTNRVSYFIQFFNRYSNALDSDDMNKSFLNLWSLLEYLTFTGNKNYDVTITRTLILFKDNFLFLKQLELLRSKRNMAIHSGEEYREAEKYSYMLIGIINEYFLFIVNALNKTKCDEQLINVLDSPKNKAELEIRRNILNEELETISMFKSLIHID